jgi:hypothetical protein
LVSGAQEEEHYGDPSVLLIVLAKKSSAEYEKTKKEIS